ncbi:5340_t:CDS:1, partial [Scutellospora calospora]
IPNNELVFSITDHEKVRDAMKLISENFIYVNIPTYIFNLPDLPKPTWNIFVTPTNNIKHTDEDMEITYNPNNNEQ